MSCNRVVESAELFLIEPLPWGGRFLPVKNTVLVVQWVSGWKKQSSSVNQNANSLANPSIYLITHSYIHILCYLSIYVSLSIYLSITKQSICFSKSLQTTTQPLDTNYMPGSILYLSYAILEAASVLVKHIYSSQVGDKGLSLTTESRGPVVAPGEGHIRQDHCRPGGWVGQAVCQTTTVRHILYHTAYHTYTHCNHLC